MKMNYDENELWWWWWWWWLWWWWWWNTVNHDETWSNMMNMYEQWWNMLAAVTVDSVDLVKPPWFSCTNSYGPEIPNTATAVGSKISRKCLTIGYPQKNPLVKKKQQHHSKFKAHVWSIGYTKSPPVVSNGHKQESTQPVQDYLANSWIKHSKFWGHQVMNRSQNYPIAMVSLMDWNGISISNW